jgi:hypothetical protein
MKLKHTLIAASLFAMHSQLYAAALENTMGLTGSYTLQNFNTGVAGQQAGSSFSGLSFTSGLYINSTQSGLPGISGNDITNVKGTCCTIPESIIFNQTIKSAAFALVSNLGTVSIDALLNGIVVDHINAHSSTNTLQYVVFLNDDFNSIRFNSAPINNAFGIDNLQYQPEAVTLTEPTSIALIAAGLFGFTTQCKKHVSA